MSGTPRPEYVYTKQQRIAELARNGPDMAFTTLAHHIDMCCFSRNGTNRSLE